MTIELRKVKLGEVLGKSGYIRGPFGSALRRNELQSSGIPVYEQQHAIYNDRTFRYFIGKEKHRELSRFTVKANDLIISCSGTLGRVSIIQDKDPKGIISQALLILRPDTNFILPEFLYYFFTSAIGFHSLVSVSSGSVQVNLAKRSDIENITISLPSIPEQRSIVGLLSLLDGKIELNRRINQTLESVARAVFRRWFVENEEAKGWNGLKWGDIATLEYGKSLSDYKLADAPYVVYGTNGAIGKHTEALYPSEGIIIGRKGAYRGIHYSPNPFFVIDTAFYLKPKKPFSIKWAYYELLRVDLNGMDSGSAIPSTSRTDFYNLPVVFPPQETINSFEDFVAPLFSKIYENEKESRTLGSLRNSLLPKLMRGEVRVV